MRLNTYVTRDGVIMHAIYKKADADGRFRTMCGIRLPPCYTPLPRNVRPAEGLVLECPLCQQTLAKMIQTLQEEAIALENPTPIPAQSADNDPGVVPDKPAPPGARRKAGKAGSG